MSYYADGRRFEGYAFLGVVLTHKRSMKILTAADSHELEADNSGGDRLASLEVALPWLGCAVAVVFIALAIIEPERVERTFEPLNVQSIQYSNRERWTVGC